jgi:hypothetical protein
MPSARGSARRAAWQKADPKDQAREALKGLFKRWRPGAKAGARPPIRNWILLRVGWLRLLR